MILANFFTAAENGLQHFLQPDGLRRAVDRILNVFGKIAVGNRSHILPIRYPIIDQSSVQNYAYDVCKSFGY